MTACKTNKSDSEIFYYGKSIAGYKQYSTPKGLKEQIEDDIAESKKTHLNKEETAYVHIDPNLPMDRTSNFMKETFYESNPFSEDEVLSRAIFAYAKAANLDWDKIDQEERFTRMQDILDKYKKGIVSVKNDIDDIILKYKAKGDAARDYGDEIHQFVEDYLTERENFVTDSRRITNAQFHQIAEHLLNMKNFSPEERATMLDLLEGIEKQISIITNTYDVIKIVPEMKLYNNKWKKGVAGTADIVFFTSNGGVFVMDTKTKTRTVDKNGKKIHDPYWSKNDYTSNKYKGEGLNQQPVNKYNDAGIQTSIYGLMLESLGYKFLGSKVLYIDSDAVYNEDTRSYIHKDPTVVEERSTHLNDFRKFIKPILDPEGKVFAKQKRVKGELSDINTTIDFLMDGNSFSSINIDKKTNEMFNAIKRSGIKKETKLIETKYYIKLYNKKVYIPEDQIKNDNYIKAKVREAVKKNTRKEFESANNMVSYLNGAGEIKNNNEFVTVNKMFKGISPFTHTIKMIQDFDGAEDIDLPIITTIDNVTGEIGLYYISDGKGKRIDVGHKRNTMLGKLFDDFAVNSDAANSHLMSNNSENFKALALSLVMVRIKQLNPKANISILQQTTSLTDDNEIRVMDSDTALENIKLLKKAYDNNVIDSPVNGYIKDILDDDKLFDKSTYKNDDVLPILSVINNGLLVDEGIDRVLKNKFDLSMEEMKTEIEILVNDESYISKGYYPPELISKLEQLRDAYDSVNLRNPEFNLDENKTYKAINKALYYMYEFEDVVNRKAQMVDSYFVLPQNNPNTSLQHLANIFQTQEQKAREKLAPMMKRFGDITKRLMEENSYTKGSTLVTPSLTSIFKKMMKNPDFDRDSPDTLMRLKDIDDLNTDAEKDFVKLWNEIMHDTMSSMMSKTRYEKVKDQLDGWIPFYHRTKNTAKAEGTYERMSIEARLAKRNDAITRKENAKKFDWSVKTKILSKWDSRFRDMGIVGGEVDEDWDGADDTEINLEWILRNIIHDNIQYNMHRSTINAAKTAHFVNKVGGSIYGSEEAKENFRMQLVKFINQTVRGETSSDGLFASIVRATSKAATVSALGMSLRQDVLDFSTVVVNAMSRSLSSRIEDAFKGKENREYDMTRISGMAHSKAIAFATQNPKLFNAIGYIYGCINPDSDSILDSNKIDTMRGNMLDKGFVANKYILDVGKTTMFVARMFTDGSIDAYSLDDNGGLVYNEKKDPRFYDENENVINEPFLKAVKDRFSVEGLGLDEEGNLTRGYTAREVNVLNSDIVSFTGSFDKAGRPYVSDIPFAQAVLKFKAFLVAKVGTYYRERTSHEEDYYSNWEKVEGKDGKVEYKWVKYQREGIFQTLQSMTYKLLSSQRKMLLQDLSPIEKKNLSRLTSDVAIYGLMVALIYGVFAPGEDDDKEAWIYKSAMANTLQKALVNASMDVMFVNGAYDVTLSDDASMFAGVSVAISILQNIGKMFLIPLSDNIQEDSKKLFMRSSGLGRSIMEIEETLFWDSINEK